MISKDDFEKLINDLRDELDETTRALVSEKLLATLSAYNNGYDEYEKGMEEVGKLKNEKEELLKVNGRLYQKIGFEEKEEKEEDNNSEDDEKIKIEDVINEKGELI